LFAEITESTIEKEESVVIKEVNFPVKSSSVCTSKSDMKVLETYLTASRVAVK